MRWRPTSEPTRAGSAAGTQGVWSAIVHRRGCCQVEAMTTPQRVRWRLTSHRGDVDFAMKAGPVQRGLATTDGVAVVLYSHRLSTAR